MPNVLVRDLPEGVHVDLQRHAQEAGQSLQQYLASELTRLARTPTMAQVLARIGSRRGGRVGLDIAVTDLNEDRQH
jgi:antitoxin FitA